MASSSCFLLRGLLTFAFEDFFFLFFALDLAKTGVLATFDFLDSRSSLSLLSPLLLSPLSTVLSSFPGVTASELRLPPLLLFSCLASCFFTLFPQSISVLFFLLLFITFAILINLTLIFILRLFCINHHLTSIFL